MENERPKVGIGALVMREDKVLIGKRLSSIRRTLQCRTKQSY